LDRALAEFRGDIRLNVDSSKALRNLGRIDDAINKLDRSADRVSEGVQKITGESTKLYKALERIESRALSRLPKSIQVVVAYLKAANAGLTELGKRALFAANAVGQIGVVDFGSQIRRLTAAAERVDELARQRRFAAGQVRGIDTRIDRGLIKNADAIARARAEQERYLQLINDLDRRISDYTSRAIVGFNGMTSAVIALRVEMVRVLDLMESARLLTQGGPLLLPRAGQTQGFTGFQQFQGPAQAQQKLLPPAYTVADSGNRRYNVDLDRSLSQQQRLSREVARQLSIYGEITPELQKHVDAYNAQQTNAAKVVRTEGLLSTAVAKTNTQLAKGVNLRSKLGSGIAGGVTGAAFSLLFGGGVEEAGGALAGGVIGSFFGPGGALAGSLIGSVLGGAIKDANDFNASIERLNRSLASTDSATRLTADGVKNLAKELRITKEEALDLVAEFAQFQDAGSAQVLARRFGNIGGADTFEGIAKASIDERNALQAILQFRKLIGNETALELASSLQQNGLLATQKQLLDAVLASTYQEELATARKVGFWDELNALSANFQKNLERIAQIQSIIASNGLNFAKSFEEIQALPAIPQVQAGEFAEARVAKVTAQIKQDRQTILNLLKEESNVQKVINDLLADTNGKSSAESARLAERLRILGIELELERKLVPLREAARTADLEDDRVQQAIVAGRIKDLELAAQAAKIKASNSSEAEKAFNLAKNELAISENRRDTETAALKIRRDLEKSFQTSVQSLEIEIDLAKAVTREEEKRLRLEQKRLSLQGKGLDDDQINQILQLQKTLENAQEPLAQYITQTQRWLNDTQGLILSLGQSLETSISGAISGAVDALVTGSKTVQEVLSNTFAEIGRAFVNMAAEIIAKQLVMIALQGILRALGGASNGGGNNFNQGLSIEGTLAGEGIFSGSGPYKFAEGGYVTGPTNAIVGEGGQSEYIIPSSKMSGAMARWNAGARGEDVIDGPGGSAGGDAANRTVPTFRLETTVINNVEYATVDQVREMGSAASQRGAVLGEARTLRKLQSSAGTRRKLGI
jgi:hypothetical protein